MEGAQPFSRLVNRVYFFGFIPQPQEADLPRVADITRDVVEDEALRVHLWRLQTLMRPPFEFSEVAATILAESHADLHEMQHAVERGCPLNVLYRIFA